MCLGVPGKVVEIDDDPLGMTMGKVSFGGIAKEVCLAYTPEVEVGDYVVVHVGFAIARIDEAEARKVFDYLEEMGELRGAGVEQPGSRSRGSGRGAAHEAPATEDRPCAMSTSTATSGGPALRSAIRATGHPPWTLMEICGGQTHTRSRPASTSCSPTRSTLVHGPGCPVCVTPLELIDRAVAIARRPEVIFTSFGDMLRVPGSRDRPAVGQGGAAATCAWSTRRSTR